METRGWWKSSVVLLALLALLISLAKACQKRRATDAEGNGATYEQDFG